MALLQLGSVLMPLPPVIIKVCAPVWGLGTSRGHVGVGDCVAAGPIPLREACIATQGRGDNLAQDAADGHVWVCGRCSWGLC